MTNPRGAAAAIGLCALLLSPPLAQGLGARQAQTAQPDLRRAIELVEEGDFAAAADMLEAITTGPADLAAEARDMVLAYLYLGISRLYLADDDDAREAFQDAQRLDRAFEPEAAELPRRVVEVWEEVRELGALVVVTTPSGAAVYLDGAMQGRAPVDITMLAPGEYRVTVALEGYRDDQRVVTVSPGGDVAIRIEMARATAEEASAPDVAAAGAAAAGVGGGGLGTGAILGIVGAGAAAGVGVAAAGGGGDSVGPAPDPRPAPSAPSAPSAPALEAGDGQLTARWTVPADNGAAIDDYDLRYRPAGGAWTALPDTVKSTSTTATITGLTNGTSYEVQVRAGNSAGDGPWSASATGTPVSAASPPSAPSAPTLEAGDGRLTARWTAPSANGAAIDDYDVRYRTGGGAWASLPDGVKSTSTTAVITGLTNGRSYEVQVRAGNSAGDGPWSASATGTPVSAASPPSAPSAPTLEAGDGRLTARWTAPSANGAAIDDYDVRYRTGGGAWASLPDGVKSTSTTAVITGLTNGRSYEVQVRAGNSAGDGPWSASATGTPASAASPPSVPSAPTLEAGDGRLTARWTAPSANGAAIDDYDVRYRTGGGAWASLPDGVKSTSTTAVITGLTNGRSYEVQVRAGNSAGDGPWSASATGTPVSAGGESEEDRAALVELYNATDGPNWSNNRNWNSDAPLGDWHGVSTAGGRVTHLLLHDNGLSGSIPSSLGRLENLEALYLSGNGLSGSIPSSLGDLANLEELYLQDNGLSGSIPSSLGGLENLIELYLWSNRLTGSIPTSLGNLANLDSLDLGDNGLTGSIPSPLANLARLRLLSLWGNGLSGPIPSSLGDLANLDTLYLNGNGLSGPVPPSLGGLANLETLYLHDNRLTGSLPSSLGDLANLKELVLYNNRLSGPIPPSLGSLASLEALALYDNQLTGSIPPSLGGLANLTTLSLSGNRLSGSIPAALCKFADQINPQQGGVNLPCGPSSATAQSLVSLSVGDARAEEAAGAAVAFAVTLSRAASDPVTVDYATRDGSARAGEDYAAAGGTLTFAAGESSKTVEVAVLDDAHDEGEETFVLALSNPSGARLEDAEATGTIENADPLPAALLARFGRASAEHVVEHVEERVARPREPGFRARFAGRDVGPGMERDFALDLLSQFGGAAATGPLGASPTGSHTPGAGIGAPGMAGRDLRMGGAASLPGHGPAGHVDFAGSALPGGDLLSGSEFELNRARHGGVLSVWSRGARSSFGGRQGALSLNGDVRTTMVGADYTRGRLVAGLSLARSHGLGGYGGRHAGQVESSATGLYPWLGYRVNDRVSVWGVTGYGAGAFRLTPDGGAALESGLSMAMASAGTRGELVGSRAGGGFALAFKADALWVGTSVDGVDGAAGRLSASDAAVTRIRTGIEGSRGFAIGGRMSLTPSVEVGLRRDGGDAETGAGVDVGGGLAFTDSLTGLSLDVRVRTLVAHQAEGFTERGMSLSLGWNPTPSSPLGFAARVAPSWGGEIRGSEALWSGGPLSQFGTYGGPAPAGRLDAELGYGLPVGRRLVGTPRVGFMSSAYGRAWQFGYRLGALGVERMRFELGVDVHRRESPMLDGGDLGVLGRARVRW